MYNYYMNSIFRLLLIEIINLYLLKVWLIANTPYNIKTRRYHYPKVIRAFENTQIWTQTQKIPEASGDFAFY